MSRILIIDDDFELYSLLKEYLGMEGFSCVHAEDAPTGIALAEQEQFDVAILDVMLPGMSGFDVLRHLKGNPLTMPLPVLMLTARGEEIDRIVGLEMGADDYLSKPFSPRELVARLKVILRRLSLQQMEPKVSPWLHIGDIAINRGALVVKVQGKSYDLTMSEMRLLMLLTEHLGEVVSREQLHREMFGGYLFPADRSLDMQVSRLRKKLGPRVDGGERIKAVRGEGYVYLLPGAEA